MNDDELLALGGGPQRGEQVDLAPLEAIDVAGAVAGGHRLELQAGVLPARRSSTSADRPRCWPWLSTKLNGGKSRSGANSSTGCLATQACSSAVSSVSGAAATRPATLAPGGPPGPRPSAR